MTTHEEAPGGAESLSGTPESICGCPLCSPELYPASICRCGHPACSFCRYHRDQGSD